MRNLQSALATSRYRAALTQLPRRSCLARSPRLASRRWPAHDLLCGRRADPARSCRGGLRPRLSPAERAHRCRRDGFGHRDGPLAHGGPPIEGSPSAASRCQRCATHRRRAASHRSDRASDRRAVLATYPRGRIGGWRSCGHARSRRARRCWRAHRRERNGERAHVERARRAFTT